jgi:hypothetical protein
MMRNIQSGRKSRAALPFRRVAGRFVKPFVAAAVLAGLALPLEAQVNVRVGTTQQPTRWGGYGPGDAYNPDFIVNEPHVTPEWAVLQRELFRVVNLAAENFYERYFDPRGFLLTDARWGANDGPDDAIENVNRWPEFHALGGSDRVKEMYKQVYEGHLQQMSQPARTVTSRPSHLSYIVDGMYYKEFLPHADWMHVSESMLVFTKMGLSDPDDDQLRARTRRFANFYTGADPGAPNYDPVHRIIRSMYNGSRGPLMRLTNGVDWVGDPSEIRNRYGAGHGEENYEEFLFHFKDYHDTHGDVPLNLLTTTLATNAYMLSGEQQYRDWVIEYVDAWYDRMAQNNWIIPSFIGTDGRIGGESGKWYAGAYGWSFTVDNHNPPGSRLDDRERTRWAFPGFMNAYLLTRDDKYLQAWRNQDDALVRAGRMVNGVLHTPRMYGNPNWSREGFTDNDGWYSFRPREQENMLEIYYLGWNPADRQRITSNPWLEYMEGNNPNYAVNAFRADIEDVKKRMRLMREDDTSPDMRLFDDPMDKNPASMTSLIRLMGGGLHEARRASPLYTTLRYFDPARERSGVPEDVAALVERQSADRVTVSLVNLNPVESRRVLVQGGAYGEHQLLAVTHDGNRRPVDSSWFQVTLEPGSGATLELEIRRFNNQPSLAFPWDR